MKQERFLRVANSAIAGLGTRLTVIRRFHKDDVISSFLSKSKTAVFSSASTGHVHERDVPSREFPLMPSNAVGRMLVHRNLLPVDD